MKLTSLSLATEIAQYKSLELAAHVELDDVLNKVTQEVAEVYEAYESGDLEELKKEVADAVVNILSVTHSLGLDIELAEVQSGELPRDLILRLGRWNDAAQTLRGRFSRKIGNPEDVREKTLHLLKGILAPVAAEFDLGAIIAKATEKFSSRVDAYLPEIRLEDFVDGHMDFPKPGIHFRDISPILASPVAMRYVTFELAKICKDADVIAGLDARGFLFGQAVADMLGKPFVMVRKKGKLPGKTIEKSYGLEYGKDVIEVQDDGKLAGKKVAIIDDLLATGGTAQAAAELLEKAGAEISSIAFVISLEEEFLRQKPARQALEKYRMESVLKY